MSGVFLPQVQLAIEYKVDALFKRRTLIWTLIDSWDVTQSMGASLECAKYKMADVCIFVSSDVINVIHRSIQSVKDDRLLCHRYVDPLCDTLNQRRSGVWPLMANGQLVIRLSAQPVRRLCGSISVMNKPSPSVRAPWIIDRAGNRFQSKIAPSDSSFHANVITRGRRPSSTT